MPLAKFRQMGRQIANMLWRVDDTIEPDWDSNPKIKESMTAVTNAFSQASLALGKAGQNSIDNIDWDNVRFMNRVAILGDGLKVTPRNKKKVERLTTYEQMIYCIRCGSRLSEYVLDIKECPHGHGKAMLGTNREGLPVITFEPSDER